MSAITGKYRTADNIQISRAWPKLIDWGIWTCHSIIRARRLHTLPVIVIHLLQIMGLKLVGVSSAFTASSCKVWGEGFHVIFLHNLNSSVKSHLRNDSRFLKWRILCELFLQLSVCLFKFVYVLYVRWEFHKFVPIE